MCVCLSIRLFDLAKHVTDSSKLLGRSAITSTVLIVTTFLKTPQCASAVFGWLRIESSGEFCEYDNEPSGSIRKEGYFLTS